MATVSTTQASSSFNMFQPRGMFDIGVAYGLYEVSSALSKNDIVQFCRIPKCSVIDGFLAGDDIDTGTATFEMDVGNASNGTESADPDALLDSGVITGAAVTGVLPQYASADTFRLPYNGMKDGPKHFSDTTMIQGVVTAAANAGGTGSLYCVNYIVQFIDSTRR